MEQAIATVESAGATPASAAPLALVARALDALTSLKFTIVCLILLMVLVVACTLAQVDLGTFGAVNAYIRSFLVWCRLPGTSTAILSLAKTRSEGSRPNSCSIGAIGHGPQERQRTKNRSGAQHDGSLVRGSRARAGIALPISETKS